MKKMILQAMILSVGLLLAGCASTTMVKDPDLNRQPIATAGTTVAHVNSQNWGVYLFSLPLFTGSTEAPGDITAFKDTVNIPSVAPMMTKEAKIAGAAKMLNMTSQYSDFGLIFYVRKVNISANAVR